MPFLIIFSQKESGKTTASKSRENETIVDDIEKPEKDTKRKTTPRTVRGGDKELSKHETTEAKKKNEKAEKSDISNKTRSTRAKSNTVSTRKNETIVDDVEKPKKDNGRKSTTRIVRGGDKEHSKDETTEAKKKNEKAENSDKSNKTRSARAKSNAVSTRENETIVDDVEKPEKGNRRKTTTRIDRGGDKESSKDETTEAKKKNEKAEKSDKSNKTHSTRSKSDAVSSKVKFLDVFFLTIFYTEMMRKVDLRPFFTSETSVKISKSNFQVARIDHDF